MTNSIIDCPDIVVFEDQSSGELLGFDAHSMLLLENIFSEDQPDRSITVVICHDSKGQKVCIGLDIDFDTLTFF